MGVIEGMVVSVVVQLEWLKGGEVGSDWSSGWTQEEMMLSLSDMEENNIDSSDDCALLSMGMFAEIGVSGTELEDMVSSSESLGRVKLLGNELDLLMTRV